MNEDIHLVLNRVKHQGLYRAKHHGLSRAKLKGLNRVKHYGLNRARHQGLNRAEHQRHSRYNLALIAKKGISNFKRLYMIDNFIIFRKRLADLYLVAFLETCLCSF